MIYLRYGANVNVPISRDQTPLHRCILRDKYEFGRLLLLTRLPHPISPFETFCVSIINDSGVAYPKQNLHMIIQIIKDTHIIKTNKETKKLTWMVTSLKQHTTHLCKKENELL